MNNVPSAKDFFLDSSIYTTYTFDKASESSIHGIINFNGTIDSYCIKCKDRSVFERLLSTGAGSIHGGINSLIYKNNSMQEIRNKTYMVDFDCTRSKSENHKLIFIILIRDGLIQKIGEYPSLATREKAQSVDYRKELGSEKGSEFYRAVGLAAHGVGIGSYVYLRRIFEFLINRKYDEKKGSLNITDNDFFNSKMKDKIKILQNYLPSFLVNNSQIYSILSKGLHELSEQECLEYFTILKKSIEIILDEEISRKKREALVNETSAAINKLNMNIASN